VLTPEQWKRWREMTGELFKGPVHICPPPGHFHPGGPLRPGDGPNGPGGPRGPGGPGRGPRGPGRPR